MLEYVFNLNNIIGVLINSWAYIYIWSKLLDRKINFKNYKFYIILIVFSMSMMANYLLINDVFKIIVLVILMSIFSKLLFGCRFIESIIVSFVSQLTMMMSELLLVIIIMIINSNGVKTLINSDTPLLLVNVIVLLISMLFIQLNLFKNMYNYIVKVAYNIKKNYLAVIMIIFLISINFIFLAVYYKYNLWFIIVINTVICISYLLLCFKFLSTENKYNKINSKYNTTLNSLKEYEEILDAYRVSNHENKNQLLTVRSMIVKNEKDIPDYIDKIIDNKIKDDEKLMFDANTIPAGGLRATIYSKMLFMKENNITFNLNVDRKVRTVELIELGEDLMLDVCKIIGVCLDNAIEAVQNLSQKLVEIKLFSDDNYLQIEITNNYEGIIDIDKLDDKGYTSKYEGHGYGLCLVRDIIKRNNSLINERKISKNIFTQILKIKLK